MNNFEKFLLGFTKAVAFAAPAIAPIFIHSERGVAIFNASDALMQGAVEQFTPSASAPVAAIKKPLK